MTVDTPKLFRRLFLGLYLAFTFGTCLWATASIVVALLRERPIKLMRPLIDPNKPADLLRCERDLRALVEDLHRHVFAVQMAELEKETEFNREWMRFSDRWRDRSAEVGRRCRLDEQLGNAPTQALSRLADAHSEIDELATAYASLLKSFEDRYLDRLRTIRIALDQARKAAKRIEPRPLPQPTEAPGDVP